MKTAEVIYVPVPRLSEEMHDPAIKKTREMLEANGFSNSGVIVLLDLIRKPHRFRCWTRPL